MAEYQCWPDGEGRVFWRHKCGNEYVTSKLPKGRWNFDGQKAVHCLACGFHVSIEKTQIGAAHGTAANVYRAMLSAAPKEES